MQYGDHSSMRKAATSARSGAVYSRPMVRCILRTLLLHWATACRGSSLVRRSGSETLVLDDSYQAAANKPCVWFSVYKTSIIQQL